LNHDHLEVESEKVESNKLMHSMFKLEKKFKGNYNGVILFTGVATGPQNQAPFFF
jgi:hypothetical protein